MTLGENIRKHRRAADCTQKEVGDFIGVTKQMISLYEKNSTIPCEDKLKLIAKKLGVNKTKLIKG